MNGPGDGLCARCGAPVENIDLLCWDCELYWVEAEETESP